MVEHLDMALCLHIQRFLHRGAVHQYGHVAVQYIHLCCASVTMQRAVQMLDTEMMMQPMRNAEQMMPTSLILFSKFLITIRYCLFEV